MAESVYTLNRNNKPFYVGCTTMPLKHRLYAHKFKNRFTWPYTIELLDDGNDEQYWIHQFQAWGFELENEHLVIGYSMTEKQKQKISKGTLEHFKKPGAKEKVRDGQLKRFADNPEHRKGVSERTTERYKDPEARKKHSDRMKLWWAARKSKK